jgi:hypothetical protein
MASLLKAAAILYLIMLWGLFTIAMIGTSMQPVQIGTVRADAVLLFVACVVGTIPAAVLYAFGSMVEDVRSMRDHLAAMRAYYEPNR